MIKITLLVFNRLRAIRPKGLPARKPWQEPTERKLRRTAMRKSCLATRLEPAAFGLPIHCSTT